MSAITERRDMGLFHFLLDLISDECNVISLYYLCCFINGSVCLVCCMFCQLVGEVCGGVMSV